jgi:hypothetical protein
MQRHRSFRRRIREERAKERRKEKGKRKKRGLAESQQLNISCDWSEAGDVAAGFKGKFTGIGNRNVSSAQ